MQVETGGALYEVSGITFEVISAAEVYSRHVSAVAGLFCTVFQRPFPDQAWRQWYLANPYGSPLAVVGRFNGRVVAHHALVPQKLVGRGGDSLFYFLSMSTMVHPEHRSLHSFLYMVDALHEAARETGAGFVLAFPNQNSAPLFQKVYTYKALEETELCNWRPRRIGEAGHDPGASAPKVRPSWQYSYPPGNTYWGWRTEINGARCCTVGETLHAVYKVIKPSTLMVLDVCGEQGQAPAAHLAELARMLGLAEIRLTKYHAALLGIPESGLISHESYVVRFFGLSLVKELPEIRFSLMLSDVF